jgi:hypothetical protein
MSSLIPKSKDFWAGMTFMLLAAAALYFGSHLTMGTPMRMGPRYFPTLIAGGLLIIGAYVAFRGLAADAAPVQRFTTKPLVILLAVILFGSLLRPLGFVIAAAALICVSSLAAPSFKLRDTILLAVALVIFSWAIFVWGLALPLPVWPA